MPLKKDRQWNGNIFNANIDKKQHSTVGIKFHANIGEWVSKILKNKIELA